MQENIETILTYSQDYPFDLDAEQLTLQWVSAKKEFIKVFGGQTIWRSAEPINIVLTDDMKKRRFDDFLNILAASGLLNYSAGDISFEDFIKDNSQGFFTNKVVQSYPELKIYPGSKLIKSFKKFLPDENVVRWVQDTASRFIQEDKASGYLYLSVDPRDFLTISENNENWTSCHSLDGDYRTGNLSYMVDNTTLVAYLADENQEQLKCMPEGMLWNSKKWRMLLHTNLSSIVYYDKQYPYSHDFLLNKIYKVVNELFFKGELTEPEDVGFKIVLQGNKQKKVSLATSCIYFLGYIGRTFEVVDAEEYNGYMDLITSNTYTPVVSITKKGISDIKGTDPNSEQEREVFHDVFGVKIGKPITCPSCGKRHLARTNSFLCEYCIAEKDADTDFYCTCSSCGRHIYDTDDMYIFKDQTYCKGCYNSLMEYEENKGEDDIWPNEATRRENL